MLANIDDVAQKMKTLMQAISQLQKQISTPYQAKKSNIRNSILVKIPKYLLLTKILPYLTFRQCHYLSNTCVFIRRTIYSPLGWKVLTETHSPYDLVIINSQILKKPNFKKQMSFSSEAEDHVQDYQDQQFLVKQRVKYKDLLWNKYNLHLSLKEKNQVLQEKVHSQKMFLFKKKLEKAFFQKQKEDLDQQNTKYKDKLKKLTSQFFGRDQKLGRKIQQIEQQNAKLQKQKQALVGKIKQYQEQLPKIEQKAELSKRTLTFLKQFLNSNDYEPLQDIQ